MTAKVKGFSPVRQFAFNEDASVKGQWFDVQDGARILVARFGNMEHIKLERKLEEQFAKELNSADEAVALEARLTMNRKIYAQTILKGWENFLAEDGETELKFSPEVAEELLEMPEFFSMVFQHANDVAAFRKFREADAVKN